jgi:O-antigen ligase
VPVPRPSIANLAMGGAAAAAVVTLSFASGGYFPADHGLLTFAFALVALVAVLVVDEVEADRRSLAVVGALAALACWELLSMLWSPTVTWSVLESERTLVYLAAAAALLLVVTRSRVPALLTGLVLGIGFVASYAVATRVFPGHVGGPYDPSAGYQLDAPIGYWNALGLLLSMGILVAFGVGLEAAPVVRATVGAALVPMAVALYFTFSRGSLGALVLGLVVFVALRPRAVLGVAILASAPALAVLVASRSPALTQAGEPLASARAEGIRVALVVALASLAGAAAALAEPRLARRLSPRWTVGRGVAAVTCLLVLAALVAVSAIRAGGPAGVVSGGLGAFRKEPPAQTGSLDRRLLSVSGHGRADYWRVAAGMVERDPLLGEGAGGFERRWMQERRGANNARDAHNLYLETLAELGPVGLALLLVALGTPLLAIRQARATALASAAAAAFAAFLAHAAVDWDWELPVLVLTAMSCGIGLLASTRSGTKVRLTAMRRGLVIAPLVLVIAVALVAHVGNRAVADAAAALERGDTADAESAARHARTWAPWSHEPWELLGEAQLAQRHDAAARASLGQAIRRAPEEWRLWFDLAIVSRGPQRTAAITRARELNPLSDEIRETGYR